MFGRTSRSYCSPMVVEAAPRPVVPERGDQRIDQFDGLRALAFLAVFAHHALHAPLLWMGVDQFFVLSGFLITRNLLSLRERAQLGRAFRVFYFRRLLRIVPPYYVAITLVFLINGPIAMGWYYGFASNVHDALYAVNEGPLNTMWSIAVEEQFYLVWPWLVLLLPRRGLGPAFALVIAAAPVCRFLFAPAGLNAVYRLTLCRMDLLAFGAVLALIELRAPTWIARHARHLLALAMAALAVFAAISVAVPTFRTSLNTNLFNIVGFALSCVFFTGILGYVRGATGGLLLAVLRHPALRAIGKVSYMAYLLHMLCIQLTHRFVHGRISSAAIALALTLVGATVSWYLLETPIQRLRHLVPANDPA